MIFSFESETVVQWFLRAFPPPPFETLFISTIGSGPYSEDIFDSLLQEAGLSVNYITADTEVLVIGHEGWDDSDLDDLLDLREGKPLRIYSQEMYLAYWMSQQDPLDEIAVARAFGELHPAIEYISNLWFEWPSALLNRTKGGGLQIDAPEKGVLQHMGYKTGQRGRSTKQRRKILERVFEGTLPNLNSPEHPNYMDSWGQPASRQRLVKLSETMAKICQTQHGMGHQVAASHYKADLEWLRDKYYSGKFTFRWPRPQIG